jgi:hypothetical protein
MTDKVKGLLACDFAEHVLHIFKAEVPNDNRPRRAIQVTRAYWRGNATVEQFDAAWKAAEAAARAAALATAATRARFAPGAVDAAWAASAARYAARAARVAGDEAQYAAWAARAATREAAERRWQLSRIFKVLDAVRRGKRWPRLS